MSTEKNSGFTRTPENSVWVRGDRERGGEVIAVLEHRGGKNRRGCHGTIPEYGYYIDHNGDIECVFLSTTQGMWMQGAWGELKLKGRE